MDRTRMTVEFWPRQQFTFEIDQPKEVVMQEPALFIADYAAKRGDWPGEVEHSSNGLEVKCWIKSVEAIE